MIRLKLLLTEDMTALSGDALDAAAEDFYGDITTSTDVIAVANTWKGGGYVWDRSGKGSGMSIPLMWKDPQTGKEEVIKNKQSKGTFCSGYTLQVAYITAKNRSLLDLKQKNDIIQFTKDWHQSAPKTCVTAITNLGIGNEVTLENAKAGDFCQLWRINKSGHSVIFLSHVLDKNKKIIGIKYRSTQPDTNGIGDRTEFFSDSGGSVDRNKIYFGRLMGS